MDYLKLHKKQLLLLLGFILLFGFMLFLTMSPVCADVGNNNRYDSGGSSSGSTSSDGGGVGLFFIVYLLFGLLKLLGPFGILIVLGIVAFFYFRMKQKGVSFDDVKDNVMSTIDDLNDSLNTIPTNRTNEVRGYHRKSEREIEDEIQEFDINFSADDIKQKASECFVTLQKAWTKRDWSSIRPFESDALFSMHNEQLEEYIQNGTVNVVEKIKVISTKLVDFEVQGDKDIIQIELKAVMRDYIIDENTKQVLEGSRTRDIYNTYRLEFIRTHGVLTTVGKEISTTNCPNCGAPTNITSSGKCSYCDSVITTGEYSWVLNELTS